MRAIEWTGQFKRDLKRERKGQYRATIDSDLFPVIERLRMMHRSNHVIKITLYLATGPVAEIATFGQTWC